MRQCLMVRLPTSIVESKPSMICNLCNRVAARAAPVTLSADETMSILMDC